MRLGLLARADSRGLGIQTWEFAKHMHPSKVLVVNCPSLKPLPLRHDWFPDAVWTETWPSRTECFDFVRDLDVVFSCETFYRDELPDICRGAGVKTVLQPNFELFDRTLPWPDLFAPPSMWRFDDFPDPKVHLPVPVATERFTPNTSIRARNFLHIVGRPALHDRNGTADLLAALPLVRSNIVLRVKCQESGYVEQYIRGIPPNVELSIEVGDTRDYWELYDGDVLILPRRYGGLCLPAQEALAAHVPVVMPDVSPNNLWLPQDWLVPAQLAGQFYSKTHVGFCHTDPQALASLIDRFATDQDFYLKAKDEAARLADSMSWTALKPLYDKVLGALI